MKNFKKIMAILIAAVMVFAMGITVFADQPESTETQESTTYTLTITPQSGAADAIDHVYKAYQIITGDISGTADAYVLSNMKWGANAIEGKTVGAALTRDEQTAAAAWIPSELEPTGNAIATATKDGSNYVFNLVPGYYVVKDETAGLTDKDDAASAIIVQVVGPTTVQTKKAIPTVDKQVYDDEEKAWSDAADHDLYESFQFKLIATIPKDPDFAAYPKYKVVFHDTMSIGVAFESIESVTVGNTALATTGYTYDATTNANNGDAESSWTLTIDDIKPIVSDLTAGTTVEVIYNAHLTNKVSKYYKESEADATPTNNKVYLEYSNVPGAEGEGKTGKTEEDTVWVFTYTVENTKYDATSNPKVALKDAGFRLYQGTNEVELIFDDTISAYRPVKEGETGVEMKSADDGKFNIKGLDAGTYTLKETTTPTGFNTMEDMQVEISATTVENTAETSANLTMTSDTNTTNTVDNYKGSTLPSTGGIGTTIFYIIGGCVVLAAVIFLIVRSKKSSAK